MKKGLIFLLLALLAFAGLGLELVLALVVEPLLYGKPMQEWGIVQNCLHWSITMVLWLLVAWVLVRFSTRKCQYDICAEKSKPNKAHLTIVCLIVLVNVIVSIVDWNGFKVIKEFQYNGWIMFIFQYLYYVVEVVLVMLIVAFGQKAGEILFKNKSIPYGGILLGLTWGLIHIMTKNNIVIGIILFLMAISYGVIYLLVKKNMRYAYPIVLLSFIL